MQQRLFTEAARLDQDIEDKHFAVILLSLLQTI